jgi:hypothetical protein
MPRYLLTLLIAATCATLGAACKKSPENSQKSGNSKTPVAAEGQKQPAVAPPSTTGQSTVQQTSGVPTTGQAPSIDAAAGEKWDAVLTARRKALWTHPEDPGTPALILDAVYQRAMLTGAKNLEAGELDAALDAAKTAVAHRPDSKEAAEFLRKARRAIDETHPYFGKNLRVDAAPFTSVDNWWQGLNPQSIIPSSDGKTLVASAFAETAVVNLADRSVRKLNARGMYSPSTGALVLTVGFPKSVKRVDLTGKTLWEVPDLSAMAFTPDGRKIAAHGPDAVNILDAETGRAISATPRAAARDVIWGGFSSDGNLGVYATATGPWTLFDIEKGTTVQTFPAQAGYGAGFGRNGRFAYSSDVAITVVDTTTWKPVSTIEAAGRCAFTDDGNAVAVRDRSSGIAFYDPASGKKISGPFIHGWLSPDGSLVLVPSYRDDGVGLDAFRVSDGKQFGHMDDLRLGRAMALAADGRLFIATFEGITILSPPTWPDSTAISTFSPHSVLEHLRGSWFKDPLTGKLQARQIDGIIANLKRTYGIDILVSTEAGDLPQPEGIQGASLAVDPSPPSDQGVQDHVARYLRDQELMNGVAGFYMCLIDSPHVVACQWYPGVSKSLLTADEAKKLGMLVVDANVYNSEEVLRQFLLSVEKVLNEKYP